MLHKLIKLEELLSVLVLALVVLCVFAAALARTLGHPIIWSVDIAQLLFVWLCMMGANQALRRGQHVGIDYFVRRLPFKAQLALDVVLNGLVVLFLAVIFWFGIELSVLNPERVLGSINLPYAWVTAAIPAGALLMLATSLAQTGYLLAVLSGKKQADMQLPFMQKYDLQDALL